MRWTHAHIYTEKERKKERERGRTTNGVNPHNGIEQLRTTVVVVVTTTATMHESHMRDDVVLVVA